MIANPLPSEHPYRQFEGTRQWCVLEKALTQLIENSDLEEKTEREYIVGFLCKALDTNEQGGDLALEDDVELTYVRSTIAKAQVMMQQASLGEGSMAQELFAERRRDAARE